MFAKITAPWEVFTDAHRPIDTSLHGARFVTNEDGKGPLPDLRPLTDTEATERLSLIQQENNEIYGEGFMDVVRAVYQLPLTSETPTEGE